MDELGDYMNSSILSIDHESSAQEAAQYMQANHVGSLSVTMPTNSSALLPIPI